MFIYGGLDSVRHGDAKVDAAKKVVGSVPSATGLTPEQLVKLNGAVQLTAGSALALGVFARPAAAVLALSLIPTTLAGHRFWEEDDAARRHVQTIQFLKNAAMLGGLLTAAACTGARPSMPWRAKRACRPHLV
jgi:putative oxidoreductase